MTNQHLVIMAGGIGSRFWPLSDEKTPKQFLDILGTGRTLIQLTLARFEGIIPIENVWVVTSEEYTDLVRQQLPKVLPSHILSEPERRNTAPCICYASWRIKKENPRANIVVAPSDHIIADIPAFQACMEGAMEFSAETDAIVTLGIRPTHPETGYGYIKADLSYSSSRLHGIFRVDEFTEKPDAERAETFVKTGNYLWNSGIFIWNVNTIINAFRVYCPKISQAFERLMPIYGTDKEQAAIKQVYDKLESISIDYAILEKAEEVFVCPANFPWSDLGTWGSLRNQLSTDAYGNAAVGAPTDFHETHHSIVHTHTLQRVVVQGLDGCIVAEHNGTLLICKLSEEQRIRLFH